MNNLVGLGQNMIGDFEFRFSQLRAAELDGIDYI
jgi:hypothetical protein